MDQPTQLSWGKEQLLLMFPALYGEEAKLEDVTDEYIQGLIDEDPVNLSKVKEANNILTRNAELRRIANLGISTTNLTNTPLIDLKKIDQYSPPSMFSLLPRETFAQILSHVDNPTTIFQVK